MRRRARLDSNHAEARKLLEANGWSVLSLAGVGDDVPDMLCAKARFTCLLEMKREGLRYRAPTNKRERERLESQEIWAACWRGVSVRSYTAEEALAELEFHLSAS